MKKIIAAFLSILFLFSVSSILIAAEETVTNLESITENESNDTSEVLIKNILSFSCYFDSKTQTVNINGTMNHDAFTEHRNSIFVIYAIPPGRNEIDVLHDENIKPIAEASASITFAFSFEISNMIERYSRFAIFMRSPEGNYTLTTNAQYAEIFHTVEKSTSKTNFKGISGEFTSFSSNSNSKKAIIPIYLDSIVSVEATKYVIQNENTQTFFDVAYLENLDLQIQSLKFNGAEIYFQYLIRSNTDSSAIFAQRSNENAEYVLPNTFIYDNITLLHNINTFLISRYTTDDGKISGIILGKALDNAPKYNSFKNINIDSYVNLCGQYAAIISNSAWAVDPTIDIAISLSADGFLKDIDDNKYSNNPFSAKELVTKLMEYFDMSTYSGIPCSIFIETDTMPLNLAQEDLNQVIDLSKELPKNKFYIGEQENISTFLSELSNKYKSATAYYNMIWIPDKNINGNLFGVAYSYAFYSLFLDKNITSFILDFSSINENQQAIEEITHLFKNIDTEYSQDITKNILKYFNKDNWEDVFEVDNIDVIFNKNYYVEDSMLSLPENVKGEFYYFNFSNEFLADNWYKGNGCTDIKINYSHSGIKALHSDFSLTNNTFCELLYNYEYSENISYTPYIKMRFEIMSEQESPLYELKLILKNKTITFESKNIVKGNEQSEIIVDLSQIKNLTELEGIKVAVRSLDDSVSKCSLWLYDIIGYSEENTSENLKTLIQNERGKIKQEQNEKTITEKRETIFWVIIILVVSTALGIILLLLLQRNGRSRKREE